jgi:hypothetical protein
MKPVCGEIVTIVLRFSHFLGLGGFVFAFHPIPVCTTSRLGVIPHSVTKGVHPEKHKDARPLGGFLPASPVGL